MLWRLLKNWVGQIITLDTLLVKEMYVMQKKRTSNSLAFDFLLSQGSVAPKKYLENKPSSLYLVWKYIVVLQCVIPSRWCYNILLLPGTTTNTWKLELSSLKNCQKQANTYFSKLSQTTSNPYKIILNHIF